jgi:high-affinity nickel-transport protein
MQLTEGRRYSAVIPGRGVLLYALLVAANLGAWGWAFLAFGHNPVLLGAAFLAYGFGLRHAVDADHIVAIDTVTRKLMQQGQRPVGVGFFFALGHSTVVVVASIATAVAANFYHDNIDSVHRLGAVFGTMISSVFLLAMALANIAVFLSVYRRFRRVRSGNISEHGGVEALNTGGIAARLFRPLFRVISRSWHMYPLGILFGLGFDTATEIGLLGISAAENARGLSIGAMLVFPALFTAGMSLIDTTDSLLMLKVYGWALISPFRKLYYNMTVTLVSALVAIVIAGVEFLGLIRTEWKLNGGFWNTVKSGSDHFGAIGYAIIAIFLALWVGATLHQRLTSYGRLNYPASRTVS